MPPRVSLERPVEACDDYEKGQIQQEVDPDFQQLPAAIDELIKIQSQVGHQGHQVEDQGGSQERKRPGIHAS